MGSAAIQRTTCQDGLGCGVASAEGVNATLIRSKDGVQQPGLTAVFSPQAG